MIPWNEYEARRVAWLEQIEQLAREAEANRLPKQAKAAYPRKTLWNWFYKRLSTVLTAPRSPTA
jgi:hypothetical protein